MMEVIWRTLGLLGCLLLGGCGTIINLSEEPEIYGGVRFDVTEIGKGTGPCNVGVLMCPDVPFSVALDTVVLPFTVVYSLFFTK